MSALIAEIGKRLVAAQAVSPEDWRAVGAGVGDDEPASFDGVLAALRARTAWWSDGGRQPALTEYQAQKLLHAFRKRRPPKPGELRLLQYLLLDLLGSGGMGTVYLAYDLKARRTVALKRVRSSGRESRMRFKRESRVLKALLHPNINRLYDCHTAKGQSLLALEYVPGETLGSLVKRRGALPWPEACRYAGQAAHALLFAHERGVVHRDVKPQNLQLRRDTGEVVLLDFGLAKMLGGDAEPGEESTQGLEGAPLGTSLYMSPEHWSGSKHVRPASDVYSLGCTLFEMLAGKPPFPGDGNRLAASLKHCGAPRPSVRDQAPDTPLELDLLVQRMMAKRPEERGALSLIHRQLSNFHRASPHRPAGPEAAAADGAIPLAPLPAPARAAVAKATRPVAEELLARELHAKPVALAMLLDEKPMPRWLLRPLAWSVALRWRHAWMAAVLVAAAAWAARAAAPGAR